MATAKTVVKSGRIEAQMRIRYQQGSLLIGNIEMVLHHYRTKTEKQAGNTKTHERSGRQD